MNHYRIRLRGQTYDVRILSDPAADTVDVEVDGQRLTLTVETVQDTLAGTTTGSAPLPALASSFNAEQGSWAAPSNLVSAPLPGVIKSVAVRPGEEVQAGQPLLVIEAMKMDNLLRASRAGVVKEVYASVGSQVAHGDPLLEFAEPWPAGS